MSNQPYNAAVWFEIPVKDLDASKRFYEEILSISMTRDDNGPNPMVMFTHSQDAGVSGHLYEGNPASEGTGSTIHLRASEPLTAVMGRVRASGGEIVSPVIEIPSGSFVYARDPDGNSIGLFNYSA
ncbi:VOC family protein [Oricola cellulosilytica]|uniref:VOC family protein n=1 Tax=Oricola cellulosilytica TaxID=1429082 RepID=A0A4R0PDA2_9HYPH|nr:VOC family protein [Oricola cellulosilytica]TCD15470.1 VOC family protein [Oricola cellulosilytica]